MNDDDTVAERPRGRGARRLSTASSRYELGRQIGVGGMGEVVEARDRQLGRDVAIKRMLDEDPQHKAIQRFLREARVQARLDHPAVVPVHELGRDEEGRPFFVMKKLAGTTMRAMLASGDAPRQRLLRAFADVCLAVELAHTRGVVHRDLKPDNIMLGDFGEVYVLDWGVAKVIGVDDEAFADVTATGEHATRAGVTVGTPGYMAPEQASGDAVDARADIYSLGCILFEILSGAKSWPGALRPSEAGGEVPVELDELCARALTERRDARLGTARELATGVQNYLDGDRDLARRRELAGEHLAKAQIAFAAGDHDDHRRVAMREAGQALALDPGRSEAAQLMSRLMLEPPSTIPDEVVAALASERYDHFKHNAPAIAAGLSTLIVMTILVTLWSGASWSPALIVIALASLVIVALVAARHSRRLMMILPAVNVTLVAVLVAVVSHVYSPLVLAPALAAVIANSKILQDPDHGAWFAAYRIIVFGGAVACPLFAERLGWLPATMTIESDRIVLAMPALASASAQFALAVFVATALVVISCMIAYAMRRIDNRSKQTLQLQAWHLRQLVA